MKKKTQFLVLVLTILLQVSFLDGIACSVCKVTINGMTYLGNNEDSWRIGSFIWFENKTTGKYGSVYVGYADGLPQGGMNEAGLAFDGLSIYPKTLKINPHKPTITNASAFIREIMQTCKSVDDVKKYASEFNRLALNASVLIFADKYGNYLVLEPDTILLGNDDKYIMANFCPSSTSHAEKLNFERYSRGETYLLNHENDTSKDFCLKLVDTMHECRRKLGDGTLYSYVADLDKGKFALYFYHDYRQKMDFNLKDELMKGDHKLSIPGLFPPNSEYKKLAGFYTPQNNFKIRLFLFWCVGLFAFSTLYFLSSPLINKKRAVNHYSGMPIAALSFLLLYFVYVLIANQAIFYFPSPYRDWKFSMLNIAAYVPFLMLILIIPLVSRNIRAIKGKSWTLFSKWLFTINSITYLTLIVLFAYWKLYNIF